MKELVRQSGLVFSDHFAQLKTQNSRNVGGNFPLCLQAEGIH